MTSEASRLTREQVAERAKAAGIALSLPKGLNLTPEQLDQLVEEAAELLPRLMRIEQSDAAKAEPDHLRPLPAPHPPLRKRQA